MPLEYLRDIHKRHDEWLLSKEMTTPVLVIDANEDFLNDREALARIEKQIAEFTGEESSSSSSGSAGD